MNVFCSDVGTFHFFAIQAVEAMTSYKASSAYASAARMSLSEVNPSCRRAEKSSHSKNTS